MASIELKACLVLSDGLPSAFEVGVHEEKGRKAKLIHSEKVAEGHEYDYKDLIASLVVDEFDGCFDLILYFMRDFYLLLSLLQKLVFRLAHHKN